MPKKLSIYSALASKVGILAGTVLSYIVENHLSNKAAPVVIDKLAEALGESSESICAALERLEQEGYINAHATQLAWADISSFEVEKATLELCVLQGRLAAGQKPSEKPDRRRCGEDVINGWRCAVSEGQGEDQDVYLLNMWRPSGEQFFEDEPSNTPEAAWKIADEFAQPEYETLLDWLKDQDEEGSIGIALSPETWAQALAETLEYKDRGQMLDDDLHLRWEAEFEGDLEVLQEMLKERGAFNFWGTRFVRSESEDAFSWQMPAEKPDSSFSILEWAEGLSPDPGSEEVLLSVPAFEALASELLKEAAKEAEGSIILQFGKSYRAAREGEAGHCFIAPSSKPTNGHAEGKPKGRKKKEKVAAE